jgi:protein phosphatase
VTKELESFALTACGPFREKNEDVVLARKDLGLFVVADGVGGRPCGEEAALLAADTFARLCRKQPSRARLVEAFRAANNALHRASIERGLRQSMAAVATVAWIDTEARSGSVLVGHIGDTRAHVFDDDGAGCQLTHDQAAVDSDAVPESETLARPGRNVVASALGLMPWSRPEANAHVELRELVLEPGRALVLVSDGVSDYLDRARTSAIAAEHNRSAEALGRALVAAAAEAQSAVGCGDNIGVVVVRRTKSHRRDSLRAAPRSKEAPRMTTAIAFGAALGFLAAGGIERATASHAPSKENIASAAPIAITLGAGAKVTITDRSIELEDVDVRIDRNEAACFLDDSLKGTP